MRQKHWPYVVQLRLRSLFRRRDVEQDLDDELAFHVERQIVEHMARGLSRDEARRAARLAMEGVERCREECRDRRGVNVIETLIQDLRYGCRSLAKNPAFTAIAVLTLGLGIGATSAIFSVINAAILRPLPYPHPDRLVLLFEKFLEHGPNVVSFPNFADWQHQNRSFAAMTAGRQNEFNLGGTGQFPPERIQGAIFSWSLFKTLGVQPAMGRAFTTSDDRPGAHRVAIISYGLWQRRFGRAQDILHRQIRLDGVNCDIIGVMPRGFGYPSRTVEVWTPIQQILRDGGLNGRDAHSFMLSRACASESALRRRQRKSMAFSAEFVQTILANWSAEAL